MSEYVAAFKCSAKHGFIELEYWFHCDNELPQKESKSLQKSPTWYSCSLLSRYVRYDVDLQGHKISFVHALISK